MTNRNRRFYQPQPIDKRDLKHKAGFFGLLKQLVVSLPTSYAQTHVGVVEDQGQTNSCVGHAVSSALETLIKTELLQGNMTIVCGEMSRLAIYYWARWYRKDTNSDSGCYIRDALKGVNKFGVLSESEWPFEPWQVLQAPAREQGDSLPIVFKSLNGEQAIKQALLANKPVVLAFNVPSNVFDAPRGWVAYDAAKLTKDWHAVRVYGYDARGLLFKNSWGKGWGRNGLGCLAWDFVRNGAVTDVTSVELVG